MTQRLSAYFDWIEPSQVHSLFQPEIAATLGQEEPLISTLQAMPADSSAIQRMLLLEQRFFLGDHNLNYTDKMSMAAGVESRVPFLDPDLMALAATLPDCYRQRGREGKWILKKAMEGILPHEVIYRPKTGFGVPLRAWLKGPLRELVYDALSPVALKQCGLFNPEAVNRMLTLCQCCPI